MLRPRLAILPFLLASLCTAQTSYERLAAAAKLWNYVKYIHPRVTASEIDWDAAFVRAAPQIVDAKTDAEFSAAMGEMLATLKDPDTRMISSMAELIGDRSRVLWKVKSTDGVSVAWLDQGDQSQAIEARNSLVSRLGSGPAVFDLRGSKLAASLTPPTLPVGKSATGPSTVARRHAGYANEANSGSGGYESTWETRSGPRLTMSATAIRPVFLVNAQTSIPMVALAIQESGAGAIVSEDEIDQRQVDLSRVVPVLGPLMALVRMEELSYADGTTGISANAVLHKTGDEALNAAIEMAKSGKWPEPAARARLKLPSPLFVEKNYLDQPYPAKEYRLLAAARIWGVFHYFHPYQHLYGEDWDKVLTEFLPRMAQAESAREYHLVVTEMVTHTHDSHCFMSSSELFSFYGAVPAGLELRWIESQPVITRVVDPSLKDSVKPGDVLTKIAGEPVQKRMDELEMHIAASTPQALKNRVMGYLLSGPADSRVSLTIRTATGEVDVEAPRTAFYRSQLSPARSGEVFRLLTPKIGYADLERLTNAQVDEMFEKFKDTDAIVMDMRGYPKGTAWSIAPRLAEKPATIAAQFRRNVVSSNSIEGNDVTSLLFEQRIPVTNKPRYRGKTVMLIDDRAISQSEHSGLFYRAANGTVFIGSPTQGANGDVTYFMAPGGIRINFSGHDVRWPDGKQLQRAGLTPDIEAHPTIAGIRAGRDEILERALAYLEKGR